MSKKKKKKKRRGEEDLCLELIIEEYHPCLSLFLSNTHTHTVLLTALVLDRLRLKTLFIPVLT